MNLKKQKNEMKIFPKVTNSYHFFKFNPFKSKIILSHLLSNYTLNYIPNNSVIKNSLFILFSLVVLDSNCSFATVNSSNALTSNSTTNSTESSGSAISLKKESVMEQSAKKFKLETTIEYSSSMAKDEKSPTESDLSLALAPSYQFNNSWSGAMLATVSQEQYGPRNSSLSDTSVSISYKGYAFNENFNLTHGVAVVLPTDEQNRKSTKYFGSTALVNGLVFNFSRLQGAYLLSLNKNYHEYKFNADGDPNISYSIRNRIKFALVLFSKLNFNFDGSVRNGYTYNNFSRTTYENSFGLEGLVTENLSVYVNIENKGNAFKANGTDSNITYYDELKSKLAGGVSYVF